MDKMIRNSVKLKKYEITYCVQEDWKTHPFKLGMHNQAGIKRLPEENGMYLMSSCPVMHQLEPIMEIAEEIETLRQENEDLKKEVAKAVQYFKEAKVIFNINTTNSFVDDYINKHTKETYERTNEAVV